MGFSEILKALDNSKYFGIQSIEQLMFFVKVCEVENGSCTILELSGMGSAGSPEYRHALQLFTKLSNGSKQRGRDGLGLLCYTSGGRGRKIGLTNNGKVLKRMLL